MDFAAYLRCIREESRNVASAKHVAEATISDHGPAKSKFMQSSLEQLIKAAEVFPVAILIADAEGRIVLVNGNTETMFDYRREELIGQTMETLVPERYRDRHVHHRYDYKSAPRTRLMGLGLDLVGRRKNGDESPLR
jgi:PAS domain S-box-containing protein